MYPNLTDDVQAEHHANVTQMDSAFGRLMRALDEQKVAENTFVFFTSDNGPEGDGIKSPGRGSSGGLRGRKRDLHEGGIRVPGLARWPGKISPGTTMTTPMIGSDLFATALAVTNVAAPADRVIDGANMLAALTATGTVTRSQPMYWRLLMAPNKVVALRDGDWKILANDDLTEFELYNLARDEQETSDLSTKEPEQFATMKALLLKHHAAVEAEGPDWWKTLNKNGATTREQDDRSKAKRKKAA